MDEGRGRRAADFAALSEAADCREYVAMHQVLEIGPGDDVLDVACGAGLALELAAARGANVAGLVASQRLVAVRMAFSTVNHALGATPDPHLLAGVPAAVTDAVTCGRRRPVAAFGEPLEDEVERTILRTWTAW